MPDQSNPASFGTGLDVPERAHLERDALRRYLDRLLAQPEPADRSARRRRRKEIRRLEWAIEWHDGGRDRSAFVRDRIMAPMALVVMLGPSVGLVTGPSHPPLGYVIRLLLFAGIGIGTAWVAGKVTVQAMDKLHRQLTDRALEA